MSTTDETLAVVTVSRAPDGRVSLTVDNRTENDAKAIAGTYLLARGVVELEACLRLTWEGTCEVDPATGDIVLHRREAAAR